MDETVFGICPEGYAHQRWCLGEMIIRAEGGPERLGNFHAAAKGKIEAVEVDALDLRPGLQAASARTVHAWLAW